MIAEDLDLKPYADKPCTLLNADQLSEYRISKPGITELSTCELKPDDPAAVRPLMVSISIGDWGAPKQQVVVSAGGENPCHLAENVATSAIGTIKQHSP